MNKPLISSNPDNFRHQGHLLVELLGDYLGDPAKFNTCKSMETEDQLTFWQNDYKGDGCWNIFQKAD